jgi:hypothetical protein
VNACCEGQRGHDLLIVLSRQRRVGPESAEDFALGAHVDPMMNLAA